MKNRLQVLSAERDWTQAELAERLDVSLQTVYVIEKKVRTEPVLRPTSG